MASARKPATSVLPLLHRPRSRCWISKSPIGVFAGLNEFDSCIRVATATFGIRVTLTQLSAYALSIPDTRTGLVANHCDVPGPALHRSSRPSHSGRPRVVDHRLGLGNRRVHS